MTLPPTPIVSLREACEHAEAMLRDGGVFPIKGQTWKLLHDALQEIPSETAPIADDSLDGRRYRYLRGRNCGRVALDLGDEEDCWLDLNPRDLDVAIDESLKLNAAPQATDAPSALGEEASNASRLAAAVLDSASLKAALRWLSRTYASQAHIGTEYEQTIESVLREQDRR